MSGIEATLAEHAFEHLFIECLGWERVRGELHIEHRGVAFELKSIAHKRGFTVLVCPVHRTVLANRHLLRGLQKQVRRTHHEHILIFYSETPRKQVWQWVTAIDGRKLLHREHPFFSNDPPSRLLERLAGLEFSLDEEASAMLTDVLDRVRTALAPDADRDLFTRWPGYAARSDELAMAMKRSEPGAYQAFVEFHMPLARKSSKMLIRWFGMDPDDAEQIAMIGLMEAARRFDPERGYQFSTYAGYWIRQICQRYGLEGGLPIRVPPHIFWPSFRLTFKHFELVATYGRREAEIHFEKSLAEAGVTRRQWRQFLKARHVGRLSEFDRESRAALRVDDGTQVLETAAVSELKDEIRGGLKFLPQRDSMILRLRYGLDGPEHTLEEVAAKLGVTRERVRQIQAKAEDKLERYLRRNGFGDEWASEEEEEVADMQETAETQEPEEVIE